MREEGKRLALVAGGSGSLGGAVARELARRGWFVGVHLFRGRERAEAVVARCNRAECGRSGGGACVLSGDLTIRADAERVVTEFEAAAGGAPGLVILATGIVKDAPLLRTSEADWDEALAVNLVAPVNILRAAAVKWRETGLRRAEAAPAAQAGGGGQAASCGQRSRPGQAILIGSYAGLTGRAGAAAYSASKAALVGLARSVARELGVEGVRVNVVIPPFVGQGMGAGASEEFVSEMRARSVLGRTGEAKDLAKFVADLAETEGVSAQVLCAESRIAGF